MKIVLIKIEALAFLCKIDYSVTEIEELKIIDSPIDAEPCLSDFLCGDDVK